MAAVHIPVSAGVLIALGVVSVALSKFTFYSMLSQMNRMRSPEERIRILSAGWHTLEVPRLHKQFFPTSAMPATMWISWAVGVVLILIGIALWWGK